MRDHFSQVARSKSTKKVVGGGELKTHAARIQRHVRGASVVHLDASRSGRDSGVAGRGTAVTQLRHRRSPVRLRKHSVGETFQDGPRDDHDDGTVAMIEMIDVCSQVETKTATIQN